MRALGFETFLPDALQAPIIVTFHAPADPAYDLHRVLPRVRDRGFILYPGKLTAVEPSGSAASARSAPTPCAQAVAAIADTLRDMHVRRIAPESAPCHGIVT